jgi:hypothetical protein
MRYPSLLLAAVVVGNSLTAQTSYQAFSLHPGITSFTSRGNNGVNSGQIFQGVHTSTFRGVMDSGGAARIGRLHVVIQDQNCSTREGFDYVVRDGSDVAGPGTGSSSLLGTVTGIALPNSAKTTACAWGLTTTLAATAAITVPAVGHWSFGVLLPPAPNWTMDGVSIHATRATSHNSHPRQEDQAWQILTNAVTAIHPSQKRSWRFTAFVGDHPGQSVGGVMKLRTGGRQGYGGSFPIASSSSVPLKWDAQLNGGLANKGAASVVVIGVSRIAGVPFGIGARLFVNGPYVMFSGPVADSRGLAIVPLLPFVPASAALAGRFYLQGALVHPLGLITMTNSQTVIP